MRWWQAELEIFGFPRSITLKFEASKNQVEATRRFQEILNYLQPFFVMKGMIIKSPVKFYKI